jgi:hypothetical protein
VGETIEEEEEEKEASIEDKEGGSLGTGPITRITEEVKRNDATS